MNYEQVSELLDYISDSYHTENSTAMIYSWIDILQEYDYEEVKQALYEAMSEDRFQRTPPQVQYLVRNLVKKYDKVDYSKQVVYCPICRRPLNQPDYEKHFDRCSSVEYVLNQCIRFNSSCRYTKRELYEMQDTAFEEYYNTILKYVMNHTTDESEKTRIGFIFNPPSAEKAKEFLMKGNKI